MSDIDPARINDIANKINRVLILATSDNPERIAALLLLLGAQLSGSSERAIADGREVPSQITSVVDATFSLLALLLNDDAEPVH